MAETNRLDRFVRDLLDLARLESDDFRVEIQPVDASLILRESWQAWQAVCVQTGSRDGSNCLLGHCRSAAMASGCAKWWTACWKTRCA